MAKRLNTLTAHDLLYCLESISLAIDFNDDLIDFTKSMVENSLVPPFVERELDVMHGSVPHLRKCRYLIWFIYHTIRVEIDGIKRFLETLSKLPVGRRFISNYYKEQSYVNFEIIEVNTRANSFKSLVNVFCNISCKYSSSSGVSEKLQLISVNEEDDQFTILLEAQIPAPLIVYETCRWEKNDKILADSNHPLICLPVADVTAQGTYKFYVGRTCASILKVNVNCLMDKYRSFLVDRYKSSDVTTADRDAWPQVSQTTYINLAVIKTEAVQKPNSFVCETIRGDADDIHKEKGKINYKTAFEGIKHGEVVIVEGRPGSGKTTLVHKISKDWAILFDKGDTNDVSETSLKWNHIKALFLIHLRGFCGNPSIELVDLIKCYYRNRQTIEVVCDYITMKDGAGICFILDGLDEYQPTNRDNFIFNLIEKKVLHKSVIIVASRPAAVAKYRSAKKHIEVLGFFKEQISEYIDSYKFPENPAYSKLMLKQYLNERPNVYHMCYLPIQLAMVCFLFQKMEGTLPETETAIYEEFTKHTILRGLYRISENSTLCLRSIFSLPEQESKLFLSICTLAFQKTISSEQVLEQSEVELYCGNTNFSFGLLTIDCASTICGFQNLYTFCHLTLQEFLAACHIFMAKEQNQHSLIEECKKMKHMVVVLKFFCGLADFGVSGDLFRKIINSEHFNCLTKIQCAFESQQIVSCTYLVDRNCLTIAESFLSSRDWTALGFVLINAKDSVKKISLAINKITEEGLEALTRKINEKKTCVNDVEVILFSGNEFVHNFTTVFTSLNIFRLVSTTMQTSRNSIITIFKQHKHPNLKVIEFQESYSVSKLVIKFEIMNLLKILVFLPFKATAVTCYSTLVNIIQSVTGVTSDYFTSELTALCSQLYRSVSCAKLSLLEGSIREEIFMISESLSVEDTIREIEFIAFVQSPEDVIKNTSLLQYTDFISIKYYVIVLFFDITAISSNFNIYVFPKFVTRYLKSTSITLLKVENGFVHKVENCLQSFTDCQNISHQARPLKTLKITNFDSQSYPISRIVEKFSYSLNCIEFDASCVIKEDVLALCQALKSCTNLVSFTISGYSEYTHEIFASLRCSEAGSNSSFNNDDIFLASVQQFRLQHLSLLDIGIKSVAQLLKSWKQLQEFCLIDCNLTSNLLPDLVEGIKECRLLCGLDISHNKLGNEGCKSLSEALCDLVSLGNTSFQKLNVSNCGIGDEGILMLVKLLKKISTNLLVFDISHNKLSIVGVNQIVLGLHSGVNLSELGLDLHFKPFNVDFLNSSFVNNLILVLWKACKLHKLLLSNLPISNTELNSFIELIETKTYLCELKLRSCFSNDTPGLGSIIQGNYRSLDLSCNTFTRSEFINLCERLQSCKFLWSLNLSGTQILQERQRTWVFLKLFSSIRELYLDNTNLMYCIQHLTKEIKKCVNLQVLSVSNCGITNDGAILIAEGIVHSKQLHTLDLSFNTIDKKTVEKISRILIICHNLSILHEQHNAHSAVTAC